MHPSNTRHHTHKQLIAFASHPSKIDYQNLATSHGAHAARLLRHVIANLSWLDAIIAAQAQRPLSKLDPAVLAALRMGVTELLLLQTPAHAAIHENVELLPKPQKHWRGFVNAVLRNLSRRLQSEKVISPPDPAKDIAPTLALHYSHPQWLVELWLASYGESLTQAICKSNQLPETLCLRVNQLKTTRDQMLEKLTPHCEKIEATAYSRDGIWTEGMLPLSSKEISPYWEQGYFYLQNESAQLLLHLLPEMQPRFIVDLCSAPGGKATHAAQKWPQAKVLAVDRSADKMARLKQNAQRIQLTNLDTLQADALDETVLAAVVKADLIIVDPPCSALGIMRKAPESRWLQSTDNIERLSQQQYQIMEKVLQTMPPQSTLLYSVCTHTPAETTILVRRLLEALPSISLKPLNATAAAINHSPLPGTWLCLGDARLDGYFIAAFGKNPSNRL